MCRKRQRGFGIKKAEAILGRPLKHSIFSLRALIKEPIYSYFSKGFRGQPSIEFNFFLNPGSQ